MGYFPNDATTRAGEFNEYIRLGDGGTKVTHYFCPKCGTTVYYEAPGLLPGLTAVDIGCFNDSDFPVPTVSAYGKRRYRWMSPIEGIIQFEGMADL